MNIIICGAGKVGFSISKQLSAQGHSVTVIDQSSEDIKKINDSIKKIGSQFGLTDDEMDKCLKNDKSQDEILNQRIEAQKKYKIQSTPTIIVNEKKYKSEIDYKSFKKVDFWLNDLDGYSKDENIIKIIIGNKTDKSRCVTTIQGNQYAIKNNALFFETSPGPLKYAGSLLGICSSEARLPIVEIEEVSKSNVKDALAKAGLL